jgi:hypothetical protein
MRVTTRILRATLLVVVLVRAVLYGTYVFIRVQNLFDAQYLESAMVHLAWRVQHGVRLYPDWEQYPHVANFYAPLSFLITGLLGRALGTEIRGLYLIGRGVSVVSVLATTLVVGLVLRRLYGGRAALFGMLLGLGGCPLFTSGVMTRPDALAEFLGLTGFFLAEGQRCWSGIAAGLLLSLAAMTKQPALVYVGAAALGLYLEGRTQRALILVAGVTSALMVTVVTVQWWVEPNFVRCLLGESRTPLGFPFWWKTVKAVAIADSEFFVLTTAGVVLWTNGRKREPGLAALALLILTANLLTAAKWGSAPNYFLGLNWVAALAGGALWSEMTRPDSRPKTRQLLVAVAVVAGLLLSTRLVEAYVRVAWSDATRLSTAREALKFYDQLCHTAENPKGRLLTDEGMIDIHHGERTVFADAYRFRLMVEEGQINPRRLRQMIADQYYDLIITQKDLFSDDYLDFDRGLPVTLVEEARLRYKPISEFYGLFFYGRRLGPSSH